MKQTRANIYLFRNIVCLADCEHTEKNALFLCAFLNRKRIEMILVIMQTMLKLIAFQNRDQNAVRVEKISASQRH